jgi:hypothetical protein
MKHLQFIVSVFALMVFFIGIYVYSTGKLDAIFAISKKEGMTGEETPEQKNLGANCPDVLIRQGNNVLLYNSRIPVIKGMNPLVFANLDEYIVFSRNERIKGNNCPVLFLQHETDLQGNDVYRVRPHLFDLQPGLPAQSAAQMAQSPAPIIDSNTDHPPYNAGQYAGFDPMGLSVGVYTKLDKIHESTAYQSGGLSDNPMDPNWGGVLYTQKQIQTGKYDDNIVQKPNLFNTPNVQFNARQFGHQSPPNQLITAPHF